MPAQIIFRCFARSTLCIKRDIARYGTTYNIFFCLCNFLKIHLKLYKGSRNRTCENCIIFETINPKVDEAREGTTSGEGNK